MSAYKGLFVKNLSCILTLLVSIFTWADQRSKKEAYFHKIYKQYGQKKTDDKVWQEKILAREKLLIPIQPGDNLWNLSTEIFGDGFYWTKLWSVNPKFKNPHLIKKNDNLWLVAGSGIVPPQVLISAGQNLKENSPLLAGLSQEETDAVKNSLIIPPGKKYPPLLKKFPASLPSWRYYEEPQTSIEKFFPADLRRNLVGTISLLPYFISKNSQPSVGQIIEGEGGAKIGVLGKNVFVEGSEFKIGQSYLVVKEMGKLGSFFAPSLFEVQGVVKIKSASGDFYKAEVTEQANWITAGAELFAMDPIRMDLSFAPIDSTLSEAAQIIGGEGDLSRKIMGPGEIVFLNKGQNAGVKLGGVYGVFADYKVHNPDSVIDDEPEEIGSLRVVHLTDEYATAVVLETKSEIANLDWVGRHVNIKRLKQLEKSGMNYAPTQSTPATDIKQDLSWEDPALEEEAQNESESGGDSFSSNEDDLNQEATEATETQEGEASGFEEDLPSGDEEDFVDDFNLNE